MVDRVGYLKVVGTSDTPPENSTSLGALGRALAEDAGDMRIDNYGRRIETVGRLVVDLAEKIGADERVGAAA